MTLIFSVVNTKWTTSSVLDIPCGVLLKFDKESAPAKDFSQAASTTRRRHRRLAQDDRDWHAYFVVSAGQGALHHRRSSTRHACPFFAGQQRTNILIFPQTTAGAFLQWTAKALDQIDHIDLLGTLTPWTEVQAFNHVLCLCVCALLMLVSTFFLARYKKYTYSVSHNHPILSLVTTLCLLSRQRAFLRLLTSHKSVSSLCVFHFTRPLEIRCCLLLALRRVGVLHLPERPPQSRAFATRTRLQVLVALRRVGLLPPEQGCKSFHTAGVSLLPPMGSS